MATKDIDGSDRKKQEELADITTCCICMEVFTDPKALPCIHTFCMKCLREVGFKTNKGPGDEMPCPICRRIFRIPAEGFPGLPKHFFIERLIQMSTVPNQSTSVNVGCDACLEENKEESGKEIPPASTYCVDCNQKYCEECCRQHKRFKLTKNHKLIQINEHEGGQSLINNLATRGCQLHGQKVLEIYCTDCKTVVCAICFIEEHNNHKGSHVDKLVHGFTKQIESNAEAIKQYRSKAETKKVELLKAKEDIQNMAEILECEVAMRKDELKQLTEKHEASLLQDMYVIKQSKLKEIQMTIDDVDAYLSSLETYKFYCQTIMDKGSANDICGATSELSFRAVELQQQCQPLIEREVQFSNICFRKSDLCEFLEENCVNLIGEIKESQNVECQSTIKTAETKLKEFEAQLVVRHESNDNFRLKDVDTKLLDVTREFEEERKLWTEERKELMKQAQEMQQESSDSKVMMVDLQNQFEEERIVWEEERKQLIKEAQELQKELLDPMTKYREKPKLIKIIDLEYSVWGLAMLNGELFVAAFEGSIFVHDFVFYKKLRTIKLKGSARPRDIAACQRKACLFVVDSFSESLLSIDPNGKILMHWKVPDEPHNLSVTHSGNILLTCNARILMYTSDGTIIQDIRLDGNKFDMSWQTILTRSGNYLVCQGWMRSTHHRVVSLSSEGVILKSFGSVRQNSASHLSDPVYMAMDRDESIIVADSGNNRVVLLSRGLRFQKELLTKMDGVTQPYRVLLDEVSGFLLVGTNDSQLLIFDVFK